MLKTSERKRNRKWTSPTKQKILALLVMGVSLGLTRSYNKQTKIYKSIPKEFRSINRNYLYRIINEFYTKRLVKYKENTDGTITLVLTKEGKEKALRMDLDQLTIREPGTWDEKWRLVSFDIPERKRKIRDAIRHKLKDLNFYELQKSLFIYPYPCQDEIDFMVEVLDARSYVYYAETNILHPDAKLKLHFKLY